MLCSVANKSMTRLMSLSLPIQQDSHLPRVVMHPQLSGQLSTPEAQLQTSKHQISLSVCHLKHIQGPHIWKLRGINLHLTSARFRNNRSNTGSKQIQINTRLLTYPKVPMTRVLIWVFASRHNLASPKSETCKVKRRKLWSTS